MFGVYFNVGCHAGVPKLNFGSHLGIQGPAEGPAFPGATAANLVVAVL